MEVKIVRFDRKKALKPSDKREAIDYLVATHKLSVRKACSGLKMSRTAYYEPDATKDQVVVDALLAVVERYPRGYVRKPRL